MATKESIVEEIFFRALEMESEEELADYIEEACGSDESLRQRVLQLLKAKPKLGNFLQEPAVVVAATALYSVAKEKVGTLIGPYKIRERLAEGGMGVVYIADQEEPVRRRVALKVIKPGMATKDVVARFEAERQALAMMDHPHIAHIFDGGVTELGQPFFAMELVHGLPITQYCDQHKLTSVERLELFSKVCKAVQHAHQKGIIHRDIKPSNVLIAEIDGAAAPKIIDFGVAKAVSQKLTDQTIYTQFSQMVGTPLYMSPEQVSMNTLDIDTRSDVYSLGVLLYELLTGKTPFDQDILKQSGFDEFRRVIREDEPQRPSAAISTLQAQALSTIAENHHIDPRKLGSELKGELDWIVMRALEKDRNRRYETASSFATDIERYLKDEPVEASPPSNAYRLQKFTKRNKVFFTTAAIVLIALVAGTGISVWQARRAIESERVALLSEVLAEERLTQVDEQRKRAEANFHLAMQAMDEVYLKSIGTDKLLREERDGPFGLGQSDVHRPEFSDMEMQLLQRGLNFYDQFAQQNRENPEALFQTSSAFYRVALLQAGLDENEEAQKAFAEAILRLKQLTKQHPDKPEYFLELGKAYWGQVQLSRWWPAASNTSTEARDALSRAIELAPKQTQGYLIRNKVYYILTDYKSALADLETLIQLEPKNAEHHVNLASFLNISQDMKYRDYEKAVLHSEEAVKLAPLNWNYRYRNADFLAVRLGDKKSAIAVWEDWLQIANNPVEIARANITISKLRGNQQDVIKYIDKYIKLVPNGRHDGLYLKRAIAYRELGENAEALAGLDKFLEENSSHGNFYRLIADEYYSLGENDKALVSLVKAEELDPNNLYIYERQAAIYLKQKLFPEAITACTKVIELAPRRSYIYKRRGLAHFNLGNYKKSLADIAASLKFSPDDGSALRWISPELVAKCPDQAFREGMLKLADSGVENAEEKDQPDLRASRASLLIAFGKWDKAREDLDAILADGDANYYSLYQISLLSLTEGNLSRYQELCQKMLTTFTDSDEALASHFTAWTCVLSPKALEVYAPSIQLARNAVEQEPNNKQYLNGLGAILMRSGQYDAAKVELEKALAAGNSDNTSSSYIRYFLAMTEHHLGHKQAAKDQLKIANDTAEKEIEDADKPPAWNRKLTLKLLRKEAEVLINQAKVIEEPTPQEN